MVKDNAEIGLSLEYLKEWIPEITAPTSLLEFRLEPGREITDYVSVHLYYQNSLGKGDTADMTYRVGRACGFRFRRSEWRRQLAIGGGGYSKTYHVAMLMFDKLGIKPEQVNFNYR